MINNNNMMNAQTRHIDIKHHVIRDAIERKEVEIVYVPSEDNTADIFTKALPATTFQRHKEKMLQDFNVQNCDKIL